MGQAVLKDENGKNQLQVLFMDESIEGSTWNSGTGRLSMEVGPISGKSGNERYTESVRLIPG